MQFSTIVLVLSAAFAVSAAPAPDAIVKRTCGTLTGTALKVCQDACKATCTIGTLGIARKACKAACDAGPINIIPRDAEAAPAPEALAKRTCGTLTGTALKVCQDACKATCDVGTLGIARKACKAACDAGPINIIPRDAEPAPAPAEAEVAEKISERGFGHKVCDAACDVACNSTVLALEQLTCLKDCYFLFWTSTSLSDQLA
ncbi:hypothetical protein DDE82_001078 [Stemphylium lycopersici]|nr:hypothetical protein TW65_86992 [Stemphylium lycopersici]RAR10689.1 hypothetical protein DDE82_001078 [Stemphylium lycopersici]